MTYNKEFEMVWKEYPRKMGKKRSFEYFKKLRKEYDLETIIKATKIFASEMKSRDSKYIKHGDGFFNNNKGLIYDYFDLIELSEEQEVEVATKEVVF